MAEPGEIDAGQLINQIENNIPQIDNDRLNIDLPEKKIESSDSELRVVLNQIKFSGNQSLDEAKINDFLSQYLNKSLTLDEIKSISANLSLFFRQNNVIAEITLPDQDITEGNLIIEISEAKMGDVSIEAEGQSNINPNYLKQYFKFKDSKELNLKHIAQRILIVNELPGLKAEAELKAGKTVGSTDVIVKTKEGQRIVTNVNYDNYGSRSTGQQRAIASAALNNPFGVGDQFSILALKSEGLDYARLNYAIPIGYSGLKANIHSTYLEYDVILKEFDSYYGYSSSYGLNLIYPLSLESDNKWFSGIAYDNRDFKNKISSNTESDYETRVTNVNTNGLIIDNLFNLGAYNQIQLDYDYGQVDLGGSPNKSADADFANTQGDFNKIVVSVARTQLLNQDWTVFGKFLYQWADQNLDSSEKLFLGGPMGVRAYPLNEGSGVKGYIANLEIRRELPYNLQGLAFYDIGHVQQYLDNQNAANQNIVPDNRLTYKGYGFGLLWRGPLTSDVSIYLARRHGKNPNPTVSGGDQDGSNKDNFVWLRAGISF